MIIKTWLCSICKLNAHCQHNFDFECQEAFDHFQKINQANSLEWFVRKMEEYHKRSEDLSLLFSIFDEELDDFYNKYENERLISLLK